MILFFGGTVDVSCIVMARLGVNKLGQNGEEVSLIMSKLSPSDFKHTIFNMLVTQDYSNLNGLLHYV